MNKTISISEFKSSVDLLMNFGGYAAHIDIDSPTRLCSASPISIRFISNEVTVLDTYPESIVFDSGQSALYVNQIRRIELVDKQKDTYRIYCGFVQEMAGFVLVEFKHIYNDLVVL